MTESFGPDVHPDLDQLADVDAGVETDSTVESHVATCPDCRRALDALRATRTEVAALPAASMPAEVASRIDAALEREAATPQSGTVVPIESAGRSKRRSGLLAGGVAAGVIAALVVALTLSALGHDNKDNGSATNAGGAAATSPQSLIVQTTGTNYTAGSLKGQISTLLTTPTFAHTGTAGASGSGAVGAAPQKPSPQSKRTGTSAPPQVHQPAGALAAAPALPSALTKLQTDPAALSQCINTLRAGEPSRVPLAIDLARFDRKAAAIFVFPGQDPTHLHVYVVPPGGCTSGIFSFYNVPR